MRPHSHARTDAGAAGALTCVGGCREGVCGGHRVKGGARLYPLSPSPRKPQKGLWKTFGGSQREKTLTRPFRGLVMETENPVDIGPQKFSTKLSTPVETARGRPARGLWYARRSYLAGYVPRLRPDHALSCSLGVSGSEAHLPAEPAQAPKDPWLSQAHEHARGPRHPEAPPRQGSHEPFRLIA